MSAKLIITTLTVLLLSPLSYAANSDKNSERIHYTCHLRLADDSKVVHQFVSVGETKAEFLEGLPERTVYSGGGEYVEIDVVYQCVTKDQRFKSEEARELVKTTPF